MQTLTESELHLVNGGFGFQTLNFEVPYVLLATTLATAGAYLISVSADNKDRWYFDPKKPKLLFTGTALLFIVAPAVLYFGCRITEKIKTN